MAKVNLIQEKLYKERVPVESLNYHITMHYLLSKELTDMNIDRQTLNLWVSPLDEIIDTMISDIKSSQKLDDFREFIPKLRLKKFIREYFEQQFLEKCNLKI